MAQPKHIFIPPGSSDLIEKFINCLMKRGKKITARRIFRETLNKIKKKGNFDPEVVFGKAISNCKPQVEVRAKRVGGSVYQIPCEVKPKRQLTLSIRWILEACRKHRDKPMAEKLSEELIAAAQEQGVAHKKKIDVFRMAQANKAFAHFARY